MADALRTRFLELMDVESTLTDPEKRQLASKNPLVNLFPHLLCPCPNTNLIF